VVEEYLLDVLFYFNGRLVYTAKFLYTGISSSDL
jgi:hypothetical protein